MATQPFTERQHHGEHEDAPGALGPGQAGEAKGEGREDGEEGRQGDDAERHRPGELVGLDQEGGAEPPQPGEEETEAPPPADCKGGPEPAPGTGADGTVDQPDRDGHRHDDERPEIERRQGKRTARTSEKRDQALPPTPPQDDGFGDAGEPHQPGSIAGSSAAGSLRQWMVRRFTRR